GRDREQRSHDRHDRERRNAGRPDCGRPVASGDATVDSRCRPGGGFGVIPTWVAVLGAVSLGIIALSCLVVAIAVTAGVLGVRAFLRAVQQFAAPAVAEVRQLIGTIRAEAESLTETSRDLRGRIVRAADAAEARLVDLGNVLDTVQTEATEAAHDVAA